MSGSGAAAQRPVKAPVGGDWEGCGGTVCPSCGEPSAGPVPHTRPGTCCRVCTRSRPRAGLSPRESEYRAGDPAVSSHAGLWSPSATCTYSHSQAAAPAFSLRWPDQSLRPGPLGLLPTEQSPHPCRVAKGQRAHHGCSDTMTRAAGMGWARCGGRGRGDGAACRGRSQACSRTRPDPPGPEGRAQIGEKWSN